MRALAAVAPDRLGTPADFFGAVKALLHSFRRSTPLDVPLMAAGVAAFEALGDLKSGVALIYAASPLSVPSGLSAAAAAAILSVAATPAAGAAAAAAAAAGSPKEPQDGRGGAAAAADAAVLAAANDDARLVFTGLAELAFRAGKPTDATAALRKMRSRGVPANGGSVSTRSATWVAAAVAAADGSGGGGGGAAAACGQAATGAATRGGAAHTTAAAAAALPRA